MVWVAAVRRYDDMTQKSYWSGWVGKGVMDTIHSRFFFFILLSWFFKGYFFKEFWDKWFVINSKAIRFHFWLSAIILEQILGRGPEYE